VDDNIFLPHVISDWSWGSTELDTWTSLTRWRSLSSTRTWFPTSAQPDEHSDQDRPTDDRGRADSAAAWNARVRFRPDTVSRTSGWLTSASSTGRGSALRTGSRPATVPGDVQATAEIWILWTWPTTRSWGWSTVRGAWTCVEPSSRHPSACRFDIRRWTSSFDRTITLTNFAP